MTANANITYALRWSAEIVAIGTGQGPMEVPAQQRVKVQQSSPGGAGQITITSTGNYPTSTNITNACSTLGTNAAAALNNAAATPIWQGWYLGGG
jgi:hypothetical protein